MQVHIAMLAPVEGGQRLAHVSAVPGLVLVPMDESNHLHPPCTQMLADMLLRACACAQPLICVCICMLPMQAAISRCRCCARGVACSAHVWQAQEVVEDVLHVRGGLMRNRRVPVRLLPVLGLVDHMNKALSCQPLRIVLRASHCRSSVYQALAEPLNQAHAHMLMQKTPGGCHLTSRDISNDKHCAF